jgi:hypothetical protein
VGLFARFSPLGIARANSASSRVADGALPILLPAVVSALFCDRAGAALKLKLHIAPPDTSKASNNCTT